MNVVRKKKTKAIENTAHETPNTCRRFQKGGPALRIVFWIISTETAHSSLSPDKYTRFQCGCRPNLLRGSFPIFFALLVLERTLLINQM
jgi:hypothetical protein